MHSTRIELAAAYFPLILQQQQKKQNIEIKNAISARFMDIMLTYILLELLFM